MKDQEFRIKEYDTAVADRAEIIREINKIEKGTLVIVGLIFSWLLGNSAGPKDELYALAWFVPALIVGVGGYRVIALNKVLESREKYIRKLEKLLVESSPDGLFTYYHEKSKPAERGKSKKSILGRSSLFFWYGMLLLCFIIPLLKWVSTWDYW